MPLPKLSTGQQDFATLRNTNRVYVDKTGFIYQLLEDSNAFFFLSRPRRFGKSLLISTLKELFLGHKHLFEGLFIEDKIEWKSYPVLHFDFSKMGFGDIGLYKAIENRIEDIAKSYSVVCEKTGIGLKFEELIVKLHERTGEPVVILIDEYDKPITEYLELLNYEKCVEQRDILRNFYSILKGSSAHIRFFFMTGISRFSKVSIFSDLNNLTDLTFNKYYHNICGYTQDELISYFMPHIERLALENQLSLEETLERIKIWYNGYSWNGKERLYNPYSILQCLDASEFGNYWFESGTPKFLVGLLKKDFRYDLKNTLVDLATFNNYDISELNTTTLLFQTGYLTIKERRNYDVYVLEYPNKEVEQSMLQYLLMDYTYSSKGSVLAKNLIVSLESDDIGEFIKSVNTLFSCIPSEIFLHHREAYYHSIIFIAISLCGFYIEAEVSHSRGRLDSVMRIGNRIYIFEFKLDKTAEDAMHQIYERGYFKRYMGQGFEIYLVGINFSSELKEVQQYIVERLE